MTRLRCLILLILLSGCAAQPEARTTTAPMRVLIIGDSISMNYTPRVSGLLAGEAVVVRPTLANGRAENCEGTTKGISRIDDWLALDGGDWDVIHFNFGLHDIKQIDPSTGKASRKPGHPLQASLPVYISQLNTIVARMQATGATLIFATTTPVPDGPVSPYRSVNDALAYNEAAVALMQEQGIAIRDLYAFALPRLETIQKPVNVHFTPAGSQALAAEVAGSIRRNAAQSR
jgi:acyl-CoA thioesterase-1